MTTETALDLFVEICCDLALQVAIVPPLEPAYYPGRQVRRLWQGGQVAFFLFFICVLRQEEGGR